MKNIYHALILVLAIGLASCNSWLDVTPLGQVEESKMFADERGFQEALAGSYSQLAAPAAYGRELTVGFPDEIVRYWNKRSEFYDFKYTDVEVVERLTATWNQLYAVIANLNLLLEHAAGREADLPNYNLIVGEAKGIRAYLHLDLLRLFGPVLPAGMDQPAIPYRDEFSTDIVRLMTARAVISKIETDLKDAYLLLKDADPIHQNGKEDFYAYDNTPEGKAFAQHYRSIRMNYYAVAATLARLYLLIDNKSEALAYAREVIDAQAIGTRLPIFSLGNSTGRPDDYMFQPELIWSIYDSKIDEHLGPNSIPNCSIEDAFRTFVYLGGYGLVDDTRLNHWWGRLGSVSTVDYLAKYHRLMSGTEDITSWRKIISMIRLTEVYYIAAEAISETDLPEAIRLLQAVRNARNLSTNPLPTTLSRSDLLEQIVLEQLKEFWGEGKLFYTYKRLSHDIIIRQNTVPASRAIFELPVPREEIEYGNN